MNIFDFKSYKDFLIWNIKQNEESRGYQAKLSRAAGFSRSFLSQVLAPSSSVHLTRDHAAGLAGFWNLDTLETEYFLALVDLGRAKSAALTEFSRHTLDKIRANRPSLDQRLKRPSVESFEAQTYYYSTWIVGAIHMLLTIPSYRDPLAISKRLLIQETDVERILNKLEKFGFAERSAEGWIPILKDLNLPKTSPLSSVNHTNWRNKAISVSQSRQPDSLHYSSVFSISSADVERLKQVISDFILRSRTIILDSKEEELYCINIDCFCV